MRVQTDPFSFVYKYYYAKRHTNCSTFFNRFLIDASNQLKIGAKHNERKKKVATVLFKKVGSNIHSQNEQICHEGLCNILNLKEKSFQTFEIFI